MPYSFNEIADMLEVPSTTLQYRVKRFAKYIPVLGHEKNKKNYHERTFEIFKTISRGFEQRTPIELIENEVKRLASELLTTDEQQNEQTTTDENINENEGVIPKETVDFMQFIQELKDTYKSIPTKLETIAKQNIEMQQHNEKLENEVKELKQMMWTMKNKMDEQPKKWWKFWEE